MTDGDNESATLMFPKNMEDISNHNLLLSHPHPAAAASSPGKKDTWAKQGQSLKRWHSAPRLATFMPSISDCPVDPEKLDDRRHTYAVNTQQGLTVDRIDKCRGKE
eukprot:8273557-Pyramimonas_sp.AAC.2